MLVKGATGLKMYLSLYREGTIFHDPLHGKNAIMYKQSASKKKLQLFLIYRKSETIYFVVLLAIGYHFSGSL